MVMVAVRYKNRIDDLVPDKIKSRGALCPVNVRVKAGIQKQAHVVNLEKMGIGADKFSAADGNVFHVIRMRKILGKEDY